MLFCNVNTCNDKIGLSDYKSAIIENIVMKKKLRYIKKDFLKWRLRNIPERKFVIILSVVVGTLSGFAAVVLKNLVHDTYMLISNASWSNVVGGNILMLIYPSIGILLTILFLKYIIKGNIGHGIPNILYSISRKKGKIPFHNTYSSLIASTLTVAFGGSVGLEAPIATTGSAIGSNIGRFFHLNSKNVILLLGCGAAGAIAGIFKAPIAGILFVLEVLMFDLTMTAAIPLLIASISASVIAYFFMGNGVQFAFAVKEQFAINQIPYFVLLGLFCGFVSVYFLRIISFIEGKFSKINKQYFKVLTGGVVLGVLIFIFPPLFGEGYEALSGLLHGNTDPLFRNSIFSQFQSQTWVCMLLLFAVILLKGIATSVTTSSGGVGGTFGPSLFLGGISGFFVATLINELGIAQMSTANFALVGMAAVMTGVMHAPLMSTFLIAEITGGYQLFAPLLIASAVSYMTVYPFEKHSIYTKKLAKHGDLLTHDKDKSAWRLMNMERLIETNFTILRDGDKMLDLIRAIENTSRNIFPVLDEDDKFLGVVVLDDIRHLIFHPENYDNYTVNDLMHKMSDDDRVYITDSMYNVVKKYKLSDKYNLVVTDEENNYIGFLSRANVFSAYRNFVFEISDE